MVKKDPARKRYPSELTDEQWAIVAPHVHPRLEGIVNLTAVCLQGKLQVGLFLGREAHLSASHFLGAAVAAQSWVTFPVARDPAHARALPPVMLQPPRRRR